RQIARVDVGGHRAAAVVGGAHVLRQPPDGDEAEARHVGHEVGDGAAVDVDQRQLAARRVHHQPAELRRPDVAADGDRAGGELVGAAGGERQRLVGALLGRYLLDAAVDGVGGVHTYAGERHVGGAVEAADGRIDGVLAAGGGAQSGQSCGKLTRVKLP